MMKRIAAMLLALLLTLNAAAFAESKTSEEWMEYFLAEANEVVVTDTQVIFTDDTDRGEIAIDKNPQKVAVLFGSLACLWYEAGGTIQLAVGGDSPVALYEQQIGRDFTQDEGVTVVAESSGGQTWDIEQIIGQKPDLIVCSTTMKGYSTISGPAEAVGIPVIGVNYNSVQDYFKYFKVFCNLNGASELWDEIAMKTAESVVHTVTSVPQDGEKPRVMGMLLGKDYLEAYGSDYTMGALFHELGAINVADDDPDSGITTIEISLEDLYAMDPEMIFINIRINDWEMEEYERRLDELAQNPVWNSLSAVQNDQVCLLPRALFHNKPNRDYSETYRMLAQYLYPDCEF